MPLIKKERCSNVESAMNGNSESQSLKREVSTTSVVSGGDGQGEVRVTEKGFVLASVSKFGR